MQLEKVVIASVLVYAVCAEGLPEGKGCVFKCISAFEFPQTAVCYTKVVCSDVWDNAYVLNPMFLL